MIRKVAEPIKPICWCFDATTANDKTRIGYITQGFHSSELYLDYFNVSTNFDFASTQKHFQQLVDHQNAMLAKTARWWHREACAIWNDS